VPTIAAVKAGTARFQIAVSSGKFSDAAEISLPVWTPATTEAFATYGTTDQNGAIIQPVQTPGDVFPQFGGLEVTTSSTQMQELTDAFLQLYRYPYECSEQISSRMISIAALRDVLTAFKAKEMPTPIQKRQENRFSLQKSIRSIQRLLMLITPLGRVISRLARISISLTRIRRFEITSTQIRWRPE